MTSATPAYRKLPGRGLAFAGIGRLWLAEDHLLEVESLLIHERYRRYFLPDITALVVRRTKVRLAWNIVHGVLGFGGALLAGGLVWGGTFVKEEEPRIMLWVFAGMIALILATLATLTRWALRPMGEAAGQMTPVILLAFPVAPC